MMEMMVYVFISNINKSSVSLWSCFLMYYYLLFAICMIKDYSFESFFFFFDWCNSLLILMSLMLSPLLLSLPFYPFVSTNKFYYLMLTLLTMTLSFFLFDNIFLFFFFFELLLVPMLFIVFGWGYQPERLTAAMFIFMYSFFSSFPLLLSFYYLFLMTGSTSFFFFYYSQNDMDIIMVLGLVFSMFVKMPIYGLHFWLPKVHVEAPTKGSMVLASIFLKLGGFGLIRIFSLFNFSLSPLFYSWCILGSLLTTFICLSMNDCKKLIAYSSISHMTTTTLLLYSSLFFGLWGGVYSLFSHGYSSSGLFWVSGLLMMKLMTRNFFLIKHMSKSNSLFAMCIFFFIGANFSMPPFLNLMAELWMGWGVLLLDFKVLLLFSFINFMVCSFNIYLFYKLSFSNSGGNILYYNYWNSQETLVSIMLILPIFLFFFFFNMFFFVSF